MERFDGKKVIECQVSDGINKADELIKKALAGDAPVYKAGTSEKKESTSAKKGGGIGHKIYTQLMNGVSHMLPFVVGGGILIAIAFLIDGLNVDMNALSEAERSNFGTITPVRHCLSLSEEQHLASCSLFWQDLLQWPLVTDRHLTWFCWWLYRS